MHTLPLIDEPSSEQLVPSLAIPPVAVTAERWSQSSPLTKREVEVLRLIADGFSAKEAGRCLGITPRTVEHHLDHSRLKTRTKNRVHMVVFALKAGLLAA